MLLVHQEVTRSIMKRNTVKMSMGGPTGGGGLSADQVIQLLWNRSGGPTDNGISGLYDMAFLNTEVT
jgi:hypothetical protein